jgi:hypothetical protein
VTSSLLGAIAWLLVTVAVETFLTAWFCIRISEHTKRIAEALEKEEQP